MIDTWSKAGTTWTQQLVSQLIFQGDPDVYGMALSPWPEFRLMPKDEAFAMAEAQTHRRFIKSHSLLDAIPFREDMKYIYVARDARDVVWSIHHHMSIVTPQAFSILNDSPGRVGPPIANPGCDVVTFYHHFLDHNSFPNVGDEHSNPFWSHVQGWFDARHVPNIRVIHYNNLKEDFQGVARSLADFLEIEVDEKLWPQIERNCSLEHMRELASRFPVLDLVFDGGGANFINKGTNGRWKDVLSQEEIDKCDKVAAKHLSPECADWLRTGQMP
jgi:aryl sulfotransferase